MNVHGDQFGEERLATLLLANQTLSANELLQRIVTAVENHVGDASPSDDITIVVVKRLPA
jgi:serine phosphatase RsbU (regulator of sigma subunit)